MDNAARFCFITDELLQEYASEQHSGDLSAARALWTPSILRNHSEAGDLLGYSINQESVDQNSFLYLESLLLADMAEELGHKDDAVTFRAQAQRIQAAINRCMFDPESGFYYDARVEPKPMANGCSGAMLTERGRGPEGWAPLFTGVANTDQARAVRAHLVDPDEFASFVPFPSASQSNNAYDPETYWRGRVWLDQVYFALEGLRRYGYTEDARRLALRTVTNAEGISGNSPIMENYHPETGAMQGATNFSWSAAHLYLLYAEGFLSNTPDGVTDIGH